MRVAKALLANNSAFLIASKSSGSDIGPAYHDWRIQGEECYLVRVSVKKCKVSFQDTDGFSHAVEVEAESLYEAAALAAKSFDEHNCKPAPSTELAIEVTTPPVTHTVKLTKIEEWANVRGAKNPRELVLRQRVKGLLDGLAKS
jgi:hypothetical protein